VGDPQHSLDATEWACLNCDPGWAEIHRLALKEDELQRGKENAIQSQEFETALALLYRQAKIEKLIARLVQQLKDRRAKRLA
jgi:hypothetical protein